MTDTCNARIVLDPAILAGKPIVRGTRLSVEHVLALLAQGWTSDDLTAEYPGLTQDDVRACIAYAHEIVSRERVFPTAA
jgi:uncharacterized protein (DUF433 family)